MAFIPLEPNSVVELQSREILVPGNLKLVRLKYTGDDPNVQVKNCVKVRLQ